MTGDLNEAESLRPALAGVRGVFLLPRYADMPAILTEIRKACMIRSEAAVRDSGISWTILRPPGFMSNALRWIPQLPAA